MGNKSRASSSIFSLDERLEENGTTQLQSIEEYERLFTDIAEVSKDLYDRRYRAISASAIKRLTAKEIVISKGNYEYEQLLPIDKSKPEQEQLRQYRLALDNIIDLVNDLGANKQGDKASSRYAGTGGPIKRKFVKVLKNWGVWEER